MAKDSRQREYDLKRWESIKHLPFSTHRLGAALDPKDFNFVLCQGGRITETDQPSVDNCYIHRLRIKTQSGEAHRYKTLTEKQHDFYPPF